MGASTHLVITVGHIGQKLSFRMLETDFAQLRKRTNFNQSTPAFLFLTSMDQWPELKIKLQVNRVVVTAAFDSTKL